ncbi:MAG: TIGR03667 family PPOX class F420-dependent oxidoreductase [Thermomicrobiales bacterium]
MVTIDTSTEFGTRVADRLENEAIIWLTTVDRGGTPQPVPVWFLWTDAEFLIFSQPNTPKLRNTARNPRVSLNFHGTETGGNIVVFTGNAQFGDVSPTPEEMDAYNAKYIDAMGHMDYTPEAFVAEYSVPIRVTPGKLRGF